MIGWLRGNYRGRDADGRVIVDVGGVGYILSVPLAVLAQAELGQAVELFVHTNVREDDIALFGFETETELLTFKALITVSGVGPKVAIGVLGALTPGENRVEITDASATAATETLPWALALRYHADIPPSDPNCAVGVSTTLAKQVVAEGETVRLDVAITNRRTDGQPMTLARIGLPAGLEPREDQLKGLKKSGAIDFWETRPREVTLYFRGLAPEAVRSLALDLVAAIPGDFEGPATSAYLYYTDDAKTWAAPLRCRVEAR